MLTPRESTPFLLVIFFFASSCATIFKGSSADIRVNSAPSSATVTINGIDRGETPQTLNLSRDKDHVLTFSKEGYEDVQFEVSKKFDAATTIVGNIFSWALVGIVVDVATGAAYSLEPADVEANLEDLENAGYLESSNSDADITVLMLTKKEWERIQSSK